MIPIQAGELDKKFIRRGSERNQEMKLQRHKIPPQHTDPLSSGWGPLRPPGVFRGFKFPWVSFGSAFVFQLVGTGV